MLVRLIVGLALSVCAWSQQNPPVSKADDSNATQKKEPTKDPPVAVQDQDGADKDKTTANEATTERPQPISEKVLVGSAAVQAVCAFITVGFTVALVRYTSRGLRVAQQNADAAREAAGAADEAAKAAVANNTAIKSAERAWLLVEMEGHVRSTEYVLWRVKNVGRSVATLIETQLKCELLRQFEHLRGTPVYGNVITLYGRPLSPGESVPLFSYVEPQRDPRIPSLALELTQAEVSAIHDYTRDLVAYGVVKYKDGFGEDIREGRFCYRYTKIPGHHVGEFRINLDPESSEYHRCT